jgi:1-deoxy-D-xylulose-5-phosphate synthase
MARLIDSLELPAGIRDLAADDLRTVVIELREELISTVASVGGHFASSLGVAELTVALHYAFSTPIDKLIWDVGHQGYIHKMLTGRRKELASIRTQGGISGFLRRDESPYDAFGAGHAGTSISAGVGMRVALDQQKDADTFVVSVIGDGAMTSGMAFEALNHAGSLNLKRFIVVLNDNEMSISPNVGALKWLFSRALTSSATNYARSGIKSLFQRGYMPELLFKALDRAEDAAQGFVASPAMLFHSFGFRYIGPVDGHNMTELLTAFEHAKSQEIPVLVHVHTVKGKGYQLAEDDPVGWHAVQLFDPSSGVPKQPTQPVRLPPTYTTVFAETAVALAHEDPSIVAITAAMSGGTGLDLFQNAHPTRFFDVGICEQHAVTFAAGLACEGLKPICAIYSTFLQRAFDQVVHDVCIQRLPVVFAIDRAGLVGNDGETHQGVYDIAYLREIPHLTIMCPSDESELRHLMYTAIHHCSGPVAVRYPRGAGVGAPLDEPFREIPLGKGRIVQRGDDILLCSIGTTLHSALRAAADLQAAYGLSCTVLDARFVKPLDEELFTAEALRHQLVCTIEDHCLPGGFGSAVLELLSDRGVVLQRPLIRIGIPDEFVSHGTQAEQRERYGLSAQGIVARIVEVLGVGEETAKSGEGISQVG